MKAILIALTLLFGNLAMAKTVTDCNEVEVSSGGWHRAYQVVAFNDNGTRQVYTAGSFSTGLGIQSYNECEGARQNFIAQGYVPTAPQVRATAD